MIELVQIDCNEAMAAMDENSVDAIVCDPPYGIQQVTGMGSRPGKSFITRDAANQTKLAAKENVNTQEWNRVWLSEAKRVMKPGAFIVVFSSQTTYHRLASPAEDVGFQLRAQLMWIYSTGFPKAAKNEDGWSPAIKPAHEPILLARKPFSGSAKKNRKKYGTSMLNVDACALGEKRKWPTDLLIDEDVADAFLADTPLFYYCGKAGKDKHEGMPEGEKNEHNTVKPVDLMRWLVRLVTPKGGIVLDPFMGSGSTGVACVKERIDFLGFEIDPDAMYIAEHRIRHAEECRK